MTEPRLGFGVRHPDLVQLLEGLAPAAHELAEWGPLRLRFDAYLSMHSLPDELITSARCVVRFGDQVVVTRSADDVNIWPGGRREPGESMRETAIREVFEETGCRLDPRSIRLLGFLHARHLVPPPADYRYPYPDFLQLVFVGEAVNPPVDGWTDTDGYVQAAWLESPMDAEGLGISRLSIPFLRTR